jgi:hypothetical protein
VRETRSCRTRVPLGCAPRRRRQESSRRSLVDGDRFDDVLRSVTRSLSRRGLTLGLAGVCIGAALGDPIDGESAGAASKKKCSSKKKKKSREYAKSKSSCKKKTKPTSPPPVPCAPPAALCGGRCVTCPPAHPIHPATCQCISPCPDEQDFCDGACHPACPDGAARNPVTCVCCLPTGSSCGPLPPAAPCCNTNGPSCIGTICQGAANGEPCQFAAQCQPGVNCVNGFCSA